ncbi:MAG: hypothetical protein LBS63_03540 [Prevotellaceae bacterium]|jgi:hypothetical protein|nr:hypothetical protein [Prevotellaceae bacterium]
MNTTIPRPDAAFIAFAKNIKEQCNVHVGMWGLDEHQVGVHGELSVYVSVPASGQPDSSLRKNYYGFMLRWRREGEAEWRSEVSTRLHALLNFDEADTGKRVALTAAWVNPRIQAGPWSAEATALIN